MVHIALEIWVINQAVTTKNATKIKNKIMIYECAFDFTICKPKKSQFIGKNGVIQLTTDKEIPNDEIEKLKIDKELEANLAHHLNVVMKQKNICMVKIKTITLKK